MFGWLRGRDGIIAGSLWCLIALTLAFLAHGLPSRTFYEGDSGVKLIAARNAISHPSRPLDIDLPRVGSRRVEFVEPFFVVHGEHTHAVTSELFPLLSVPALSAFGVRGLFILPAAGFLLILAAAGSLGRALDRDRSVAGVILVTATTTPFLFYALEFWEHTLAVGAAAAGTAIFLGQRRSRARQLTAGLLFGTSALLRPEAVWFVVAVAVGSRLLEERPRARDLAVVFAGAGAVYVPWLAWSFAHSGALFNTHLSTNLSGITNDWGRMRLTIAAQWIQVPTTRLALACAGTAAVGLSAAVVTTGAPILRLAAVLLALVIAWAAAMGAFPPVSVWCAAPLTIVALSARWNRSGGRRFLWTVMFLTSLLVFLTAPNDGGSQWGPRYLLFAFVPAAILVADVLQSIARQWRVAGGVAMALVVGVSGVVQFNAYTELRCAKQNYERLVALTERETSAGSSVVTDLWWFDQVVASLYPSRTILFVPTTAAAREAMRLLADADVTNVAIVRSRDQSASGTIDQWLDATGFVQTRAVDSGTRAVTFYHVEKPRKTEIQ